jgi:hypothetical protein
MKNMKKFNKVKSSGEFNKNLNISDVSLRDLLASTDMDAMYKQMKMEVNTSKTQEYYKSKEVQDLDNSNDVVDYR